VKFSRTPRGFAKYEFTDHYDHDCSLQKSSLASKDCIWLGCDKEYYHHISGENIGARMHLTRSQVAILIGLLQHFVDEGELPEVNF